MKSTAQTNRTPLTPEQRSTFENDGFVRLPRVFTRDDAAAMEDRIWRELERRHGVRRDDPASWTVSVASGLQRLRTHPAFAPIGGETLLGALDDLMGAGSWQVPKHWGQFLVTFPTGDAVSDPPPRLIWHTDLPFTLPTDRLLGALVFSFLSEVPEDTGGTLVIAGSPGRVARFVEERPRLREAKMKVTRRALMSSDSWLTSINEMAAGDCGRERLLSSANDAGTLRVEQLTGEPGDVVVGHPWLLHTPFPNFGDRPRLMCVQRIGPARGTT